MARAPRAARKARPFIFVLAGVNGAGKSSVGGALLAEHGLTWFNPDTHARELVAALGLPIQEANARAWQQGRTRLEAAMANGQNFAFETTLGANTIPQLLAQAASTHDVVMIYCGLASVEHHLKRVKARVEQGGHDIPTDKIRERWTASRLNLIRLMPHLARLQVFDNSVEVAPGQPIADPVLLLDVQGGLVRFPGPGDAQALRATPEWARPVLQAAFEHQARLGGAATSSAAPDRKPAAKGAPKSRKLLQ
ncbi:zeta toxin family protein [Variovorax dokdonensis]|uniref:Zeta toxin family protein n=1 Tax=Variovorax dokdonensis TaxID=344883 RepID=A0ABT7NGR8_9BURK|nr:AAA family ATPase [Variovorax dokdonensis]MDM0047147.1 zeta toxin family protein [Variovorax dokdonensis]